MKLHLKLVLDVKYDVPDKEIANYLKHRLHFICDEAMRQGMLTGESEAEVDTCSWKVKELKR